MVKSINCPQCGEPKLQLIEVKPEEKWEHREVICFACGYKTILSYPINIHYRKEE